jgi:hypothetical protein
MQSLTYSLASPFPVKPPSFNLSIPANFPFIFHAPSSTSQVMTVDRHPILSATPSNQHVFFNVVDSPNIISLCA